MKLLRLAGLFASIAALVAVPALALSGGSNATKVRLELDWIPTSNHVAFYYAEKKGYFAKAGSTSR